MIQGTQAGALHQQQPEVADLKVGRDLTIEEQLAVAAKVNNVMSSDEIQDIIKSCDQTKIKGKLKENYDQIYTLLTKVKIRRNELSTRLDELSELNKRVLILNNESNELKSQLEIANSEEQQNLTRINELTNQLEDKEKEINNLNARIVELKDLVGDDVLNLVNEFKELKNEKIKIYKDRVIKLVSKSIYFNKKMDAILKGHSSCSSASGGSGSTRAYLKSWIYWNYSFFTEKDKMRIAKGIQRTIDAVESMSIFVKGALNAGLSLECVESPEKNDFNGDVVQSLEKIKLEINNTGYLEKRRFAHLIDCMKHVQTIQKNTLGDFSSMVQDPQAQIHYDNSFSLGGWKFELIKKS